MRPWGSWRAVKRGEVHHSNHHLRSLPCSESVAFLTLFLGAAKKKKKKRLNAPPFPHHPLSPPPWSYSMHLPMLFPGLKKPSPPPGQQLLLPQETVQPRPPRMVLTHLSGSVAWSAGPSPVFFTVRFLPLPNRLLTPRHSPYVYQLNVG